MSKSILIVEDDQDLREAIMIGLTCKKYKVYESASLDEAESILKENRIDLILADVQLDQDNGLDLLGRTGQYNSRPPIIYMTAHARIDHAVYAIQKGAVDYLTKPFELVELIEKIENTIVSNDYNKSIDNVMSNHAQMVHIYRLAGQVAPTNATVMLTGESGTGKEILAQFIHAHSNRADKPFVAVNCAAIPDNMLEAMLFGYEKGAFTGAHQSTPGKFEQANHGTLLLDEVSEMPLTLQAKLLRVIQEKEVERLGGKNLISLDVRIIATTNRDLAQAVRENQFRSDLYFRLNVFPLNLVPLRERKEDIANLAKHFLNKYKQNNNQRISKRALEKLESHVWPGNVRELENVIQRACIICNAAELDVKDIVLESMMPENEVQANRNGDLSVQIKHAEHDVIVEFLKKYNGNKSKVAEMLGISPRTLRYKLAKMKELGFVIP